MKRSKENKNPNVHCYEFYVDGMHCAACELLIEKKLSKVEGVEKVDAVLDKNKVKVYVDSNETAQELAQELTELIHDDGYTLYTEKQVKNSNALLEFAYALPISALFIALFILLQLSGFINFFSPDGRNFGGVFVLGLLASVSSCMAIVGGLALSISANQAKTSKSNEYKPQIYFHIGRLIGFFVFGIGIGIIGLGFREYLENSSIPNLLHLFAAIVMVILGINLLDVFQFTKKLQIKAPKFLSKKVFNSETRNAFSPFLIGALTFFLPCGFTINVQTEALASSTPLIAGIKLLIFALGTLPALALISFSSVNLSHSKIFRSGVFYKTAGLIVIGLALVNIYGYFAAEGIVRPLF